MNTICYNHAINIHTMKGALAGIEAFLGAHSFTSLLDVGAGTGNWLAAAQTHGISDAMGIDGVRVDESLLRVPRDLIVIHDLREPFRLGRKFDAAICLEVAEHLPETSAQTLVESICAHANYVFFSAAAPEQGGDNHVNCQPPNYWQQKFNSCGFVCSDPLRARIWSEEAIEPWYRQNLFVASYDPDKAGHEPRILFLIHPDMIPTMYFLQSPSGQRLARIESGAAGTRYYLTLLRKSLNARAKRLIARISDKS